MFVWSSGLKQTNVMCLAKISPKKNRVHTAGGRVMREHVNCPIDISGDYEVIVISSPTGLVGFAKIGRLKINGHGSKAEVIYQVSLKALGKPEFTGQLSLFHFLHHFSRN